MKLHLGCGETYLPGYVNVDFPPTEHTVQQTSTADVHADVAQLTYPAESVAEVRLHHLFEHFDRATATRLLIDWYEWLEDGGRLVIETPDFKRCARAFVLRRKKEDQLRLLRHIFGSHEAPWAVHYEGWYREKFELWLTALGFSDLSFERSRWHGTYNLTVTARKFVPSRSRGSLVRAAEELLRLSLVDDTETEQRILGTWMERLQNPGPERVKQ